MSQGFASSGTTPADTQPISVTTLPLPAGAAQDGTDITTPTSMPAGGGGIRGWLSAIWTKLNGTLAVTGTFWQATQPVSGTVAVSSAPTTAVTGPLTDTQIRATALPVSGTVAVSNPTTNPETGLAKDATLTGGTQRVQVRSGTKGTSSAADLTSTAVDVNTQALHTSVTNFPATQPVSLATNTPDVTDRAGRQVGHVTVDSAPTTAVTGPVTDTQLRASAVPVSLATNTPDVTDRAARALGVVASITNALPTGSNTIGTTNPPAITKGTQGTVGVTTQDLKDAGRTRVTIGFQAVAPATADTLLSMVKTSAGVAAAGATSVGVTAGKTLRITGVVFSLKANAATAAFGTITLRSNPSGATVIGSQSELRLDVGNTEAVVGAARAVSVEIPDGLEFSGTQTIGVSLAAQAVTNIVSISLLGFEY